MAAQYDVHSDAARVVAATMPSGAGSPLKVDSSGYLYVNLTNGGGGGASATDQAPFVAGVSAGTPIMAEDPTSGQLLVAQMSPGTRQLAVAATVSVGAVTSSAVSAAGLIVVGTGSTAALATNTARKRLILQNVGTTTLYILFGAGTPSSTVFHLVFPAGGSAKDGFSSPYIDSLWIGAVSVASSAPGGSLSVAEFS